MEFRHGMGQSNDAPRTPTPEGRCHGMGIPAKEAIGKMREDIENFKATFRCPAHNVKGVPAFGDISIEEARVHNWPSPVSIGLLQTIFKEALLRCPNADCGYNQYQWRCPHCRLWMVSEYGKTEGRTWICCVCLFAVSLPGPY